MVARQSVETSTSRYVEEEGDSCFQYVDRRGLIEGCLGTASYHVLTLAPR